MYRLTALRLDGGRLYPGPQRLGWRHPPPLGWAPCCASAEQVQNSPRPVFQSCDFLDQPAHSFLFLHPLRPSWILRRPSIPCLCGWAPRQVVPSSWSPWFAIAYGGVLGRVRGLGQRINHSSCQPGECQWSVGYSPSGGEGDFCCLGRFPCAGRHLACGHDGKTSSVSDASISEIHTGKISEPISSGGDRTDYA